MFARLLVLLASLSLVVNLSSAANLRQDISSFLFPKAAEIPIDHVRAEKAYQSFMNDAATRGKNDRKLAENYLTTAHSNARKQLEDLHKAGKLQAAIAEQAAKGQTAVLSAVDNNNNNNNNGNQIRNGAFVVRNRPNGDCSGISKSVSAIHMGLCTNFESGSYSIACVPSNSQGDVELHSRFFTGPGCNEQDFFSDTPVYPSFPKCEFNDYGDQGMAGPSMAGPSMVTAQCTAAQMDVAINKGGIAVAFFDGTDNSVCAEGSPTSVTVQRYGGCQLVYDHDKHGHQRYHYFRIDSCSQETGKAHMTAFSDPACLRPLYRGSFNAAPGNQYMQCLPDMANGGFNTTICFPVGGMNNHH